MEQKRALPAKAYAALPPRGVVIVYEALIDNDRRENAFGLLMSLNMLIDTPSGHDHVGLDCEGWMRAASFHKTCVEHLVGPRIRWSSQSNEPYAAQAVIPFSSPLEGSSQGRETLIAARPPKYVILVAPTINS